MVNFPEDHLQYTEPEEDFRPRCWDCGDEMWSNSRMYNVEGHWFCEDCFTRWIDDAFDANDLAEAFAIESKNAGDLLPENME